MHQSELFVRMLEYVFEKWVLKTDTTMRVSFEFAADETVMLVFQGHEQVLRTTISPGTRRQFSTEDELRKGNYD